MNVKHFERALKELDNQIMRNNRTRRGSRLEGVRMIKASPSDDGRVQSLIEMHNHKARSYNGRAGELGRVMQAAVNRKVLATRPQEELCDLNAWLGLLEEWLRLRRRQHVSVFQGIEPRLHALERAMEQTLNGPGGIRELRDEITRMRDQRRD